MWGGVQDGRIAHPKDLLETHALFFMGFPNAAQVHQKMLAVLTGGRNRADIALAEPIVLALDGKTQVLDPEDQNALADDLAGAKGEGPSAEIAELRLVAACGTSSGPSGARFTPAEKLGNQTIIGTFLKAAQGAGAWPSD